MQGTLSGEIISYATICDAAINEDLKVKSTTPTNTRDTMQ